MLGVVEIGTYEAKGKLSELIRRAREGERIIITSHDQPVAELVPYQNNGERKDVA